MLDNLCRDSLFLLTVLFYYYYCYLISSYKGTAYTGFSSSSILTIDDLFGPSLKAGFLLSIENVFIFGFGSLVIWLVLRCGLRDYLFLLLGELLRFNLAYMTLLPHKLNIRFWLLEIMLYYQAFYPVIEWNKFFADKQRTNITNSQADDFFN